MGEVNTEQGKLKHLLETEASCAKEMQKKSKFATHSHVQVIDFIFLRIMIIYIIKYINHDLEIP